MTPDMTLRVAAKTLVADSVALFELVPAHGGTLPPFSAGAHLRVQLPGALTRAYSLCNNPTETGRYQIAVYQEPHSRGGSRAMHEQVRPGDLLPAWAPANHFPLDETAAHTVLVAGGIGITPMMAMAWRLHRLDASWELHYAARSAVRCAFLGMLRDAPFAAHVHIHLDDGSAGEPLDVARILARAPEGAHAYVCGPSGLIDHVLATGRELQWPESRLHHERFAADPAQATGGRPFRLVLAHSGLTLEVPAGRSAAAVIHEAGIDLPVSCEQGMCGTCITDVLAGEPDHRDECLSEADRARCFTPCCSRAVSDSLTIAL